MSLLTLLSLTLVLTLPVYATVPGYLLSHVVYDDTGITGTLTLREGQGPYGHDVTPLRLRVSYDTTDRVHVKIDDPGTPRWDPTSYVVVDSTPSYAEDRNYAVDLTSNPFGFSVSRNEDQTAVLFDSRPPSSPHTFDPMVFEDQFLEITTSLRSASPSLYGLGEHVRSMKLEVGRSYPMWSRGDLASPPFKNLYGVQPFLMEIAEDGTAHGVLFLNSNAMEVVIRPFSLTFRSIGGVLDVYLFMGPSPAKVVQQYTELVGRPYMPPYWTLGFHQCRWGYESLDVVKDVVHKYKEAQIPLEAMWVDIDYMDGYRIFTSDPVTFPAQEMKEFSEDLRRGGQHMVVIVDPGVKVDTEYSIYQALTDDPSMCIRDPATLTCAPNSVWPGDSVWLDFFEAKTKTMWKQWISDFFETHGEMSGLWIDMNEPDGFCAGRCNDTWNPTDPYNVPPYTPGKDKLYVHTLSMTDIFGPTTLYNAHSMYGHMETIATMEAMHSIRGKRSLVLTRSTFSGTGHYGSHWLGDNVATFEHLAWSISGMLMFQFFGIPLVGADICGFQQDTTEELCARWALLGAFYPFSRNHNEKGASPQEFYLWPQVKDIARVALRMRYDLLPFYYTLFHWAHIDGSTVVRPLFFEFTSDPTTWSLDRQFLVGASLLVSPVLEQGARSVVAYFPAGQWYDYRSGTLAFDSQDDGVWATLDAPLNFIPLHLRAGSIIATQPGEAMTTAQAREQSLVLLVALKTRGDSSDMASGNLFWDDGESLDTETTGVYTLIEYTATHEHDGHIALRSSVLHDAYPGTANLNMNDTRISGVLQRPSFIEFRRGEGTPIEPSYSYDEDTKVLTVENLATPANAPFVLRWCCQPTDDDKNGKTPTLAIALGVSGGVLAIVLIVVAWVVWKKKRGRGQYPLGVPYDEMHGPAG